MSPADVQIIRTPEALVAHLVGEIDMSNAADLGEAVIGATPGEANGVVLDLSNVDYVDSAGISAIHDMRTSLRARGQTLVLVIPARSAVHDTLRLSGAQRYGDAVEQLDDALRVLGATPSADS